MREKKNLMHIKTSSHSITVMKYKDYDMGAHYFYFLMKQQLKLTITTHIDLVMESFLIGRT